MVTEVTPVLEQLLVKVFKYLDARPWSPLLLGIASLGWTTPLKSLLSDLTPPSKKGRAAGAAAAAGADARKRAPDLATWEQDFFSDNRMAIADLSIGRPLYKTIRFQPTNEGDFGRNNLFVFFARKVCVAPW